jgi:hypothetical protein
MIKIVNCNDIFTLQSTIKVIAKTRDGSLLLGYTRLEQQALFASGSRYYWSRASYPRLLTLSPCRMVLKVSIALLEHFCIGLLEESG